MGKSEVQTDDKKVRLPSLFVRSADFTSGSARRGLRCINDGPIVVREIGKYTIQMKSFI